MNEVERKRAHCRANHDTVKYGPEQCTNGEPVEYEYCNTCGTWICCDQKGMARENQA